MRTMIRVAVAAVVVVAGLLAAHAWFPGPAEPGDSILLERTENQALAGRVARQSAAGFSRAAHMASRERRVCCTDDPIKGRYLERFPIQAHTTYAQSELRLGGWRSWAL